MKRIFGLAMLAGLLAGAGPIMAQETPTSTSDSKEREAATEVKKSEPEAKNVRTPFGISKRGAPRPADTSAQDRMVQVKKKGDVYEFRRKTPFGYQVWTKAEAEFNANEKRWFEASRKKATPAPKN